jgi:7-cyano-7-deazaguanine synthase
LSRALTLKIHGTAEAELRAARQIGERVGVLEHRFVSIPELREARDIKGSTELSRKAVPPTYIPMKNAVFYSLAAAFAEEKGSGVIMGGHNGDDRRVFEDTSEEFFAKLGDAFRVGSPRLRRHGLRIVRPLKDKGKAEVVALAAQLKVPFELTWSCHRDGSRHCWECEGCEKRARAFREAGVEDPLNPKKV